MRLNTFVQAVPIESLPQFLLMLRSAVFGDSVVERPSPSQLATTVAGFGDGVDLSWLDDDANDVGESTAPRQHDLGDNVRAICGLFVF